MIGEGQAHVRTVVAIAQAQHKDETAIPSVQAWASLGNYGRSSSNEERDLRKWLRNLFDLQLEVYWTTLKLQAIMDTTLHNCSHDVQQYFVVSNLKPSSHPCSGCRHSEGRECATPNVPAT